MLWLWSGTSYLSNWLRSSSYGSRVIKSRHVILHSGIRLKIFFKIDWQRLLTISERSVFSKYCMSDPISCQTDKTLTKLTTYSILMRHFYRTGCFNEISLKLWKHFAVFSFSRKASNLPHIDELYLLKLKGKQSRHMPFTQNCKSKCNIFNLPPIKYWQ